jgi:integral membrane sensor domain MASE1
MMMGVTYFLAAQLSLALLSMPDGVAVFWPAAGIAAGTIIALGPATRVAVAAGVIGATIAANLAGDRNLASAIVFALSNAGEAVLLAWLIEYWFGLDFNLDALRRVVGFFLATALATSMSGIAGAAGIVLFHSSEASMLTVWMRWLASDAIGVVTVAPLMIGLIRILSAPAERSEILEGVASLFLLAVVSTFSFGQNYLFTVLPLGLLLPLLIWPAARCPRLARDRRDNDVWHRSLGRSEHRPFQSRACGAGRLARHIHMRPRLGRAVCRHAQSPGGAQGKRQSIAAGSRRRRTRRLEPRHQDRPL